MKIISATTDDLEHLVKLFDGYRQFYGQPSDLEGCHKFLKNIKVKLQSEIFIAYDNSVSPKVGMGFLQMYPTYSSVSMKRLWILNDIYVNPDYRRKGVAEALIDKAKQLAQETKSAGILLETLADNVESHKLYQKVGFERNPNFFFRMKIDPAMPK